MADEAVKKLPKPIMRDLLMRQIRRNLIGCFIFCSVAVAAVKIGINDRKKKAYSDFYQNYDIDKEFHKMRKKGLFDSCSVEDDDD
ncbi:hypothetical protein HHI36_001414 [Cryptolaemus montrouzieri]|uniref:Mitochondrial cytochrome c oxidase subunit VIc/VIIs domain-containing protein n=1 Tax=Cryptolaemus montrouzieri TaxID=559131 RepID=A0ABD2P7X1_9CUCU